MRTGVDVDGMDELITVLGSAGRSIVREARGVVSKGSLNIKQDWQRRWNGLGHVPHLPRAIGYDLTTAGTVITGETGPDIDSSQGPLAHIIEHGAAEYGQVNNAPNPGGLTALEAEEPRFVRAVEDLAQKLLEGR